MPDLVSWDDPILYKETVPFDFVTQNAQETFDILRDALYNGVTMKGYGLSANQIGLPYSVFVFGDGRHGDSIVPVFNPVITSVSSETEAMDEGCLSFPGL